MHNSEHFFQAFYGLFELRFSGFGHVQLCSSCVTGEMCSTQHSTRCSKEISASHAGCVQTTHEYLRQSVCYPCVCDSLVYDHVTVCCTALSSVYTDVGSYLEEVRNALEEDEAGDKALLNVVGQKELPPRPPELTELQNEFRKYEAAHQAASQTNTDLHKAMNKHIPNLHLLQGPLDELRNSLAQPQLSEGESLQRVRFYSSHDF